MHTRIAVRHSEVRSSVTLLALCFVAFLAIPASAQIGPSYDASFGTLPSAQGFVHFVSDPAPPDALSEANFSVAGGQLTMGDSGGPNADVGNRQEYQTTNVGYDFDGDVVEIEFRLRITTSTWTLPGVGPPRAGFGISVTDLDGDQIVLYIGGGALFLDGAIPLPGSIHTFDATASMTDYVLRIDTKGASVQVDGVEQSSALRSGFVANAGANPELLRFGDLTGLERGGFELEYLRVVRSSPPVAEVRDLEMVTQLSVPAGAFATVTETATCPPGKTALGGGAAIIGAEDESFFHASQSTAGAPPTGWTATAEALAGAGTWSLRVDVLCGELPGLQAFDLVDSKSTASGSTVVSCPFSKSPVSGGAELTEDPPDAFPRLWGIGVDASGQTSVAQAGDLDFSGVPEGVNWLLSSSVTCSDVHDWVVVSDATPPGSYSSFSPKQATAICPFGSVVIGGGARVVGDGRDSAVLSVSRPQAVVPGLPDRWLAIAHDTELLFEDRGVWGVQATAICATEADPTVARRGRIGRWRADSGTPADDHGVNDGTLRNGASIESGIDDQSFSLERVGEEWLEIPGDDFYPQAAFTADVWIETDSLAPSSITAVVNLNDISGLNPGGSNFSSWRLLLSQEGYATATMRAPTSSTTVSVADDVDLSDGERHHLAIVRDSDAGLLRLYVDGDEEASDLLASAAAALSPGDLAAPDPLTVGVRREPFSTDLTREFEGLIDDLKYYDRALSPEEIARIAGCGVPVLPRVLNVDANRFGGAAGVPDSHKLCVMLDAGSYELRLVTPALDPDARFTAWAPDGSPSGAWRTDWSVVGEVDAGLSGGDATPQATAQIAFDGTSPRSWQLTLSTPQRVYFGIEDSAVLDNQGGVSIALPEPGSTASIAAGLGLLIALARLGSRRRA